MNDFEIIGGIPATRGRSLDAERLAFEIERALYKLQTQFLEETARLKRRIERLEDTQSRQRTGYEEGRGRERWKSSSDNEDRRKRRPEPEEKAEGAVPRIII